MSEITDAALRFRRDMLNREKETADAILLNYKAVYGRIDESLRSLLKQIREKEQAKEKVSRAWLLRQERYKFLLSQVESEIGRFAQFASDTVRISVYAAIEAGDATARELGTIATGGSRTWNRLPVEALNEIAAVLQNDSPVMRLFASLPIQTTRAIRDTLFAGLAAGSNPKQTARKLRSTAGLSLSRALTISRTETLRAYRTATLEGYRANSDVVTGWRWIAALSARTCPACLALHGKSFTLEEEFGAHPNCRCTTVPITESVSGLSFGEEWFRAQPADTQREILGKAKYATYSAGRITLPDLVHEEKSRVWGLTRSEASLKEALQNARQRRQS